MAEDPSEPRALNGPNGPPPKHPQLTTLLRRSTAEKRRKAKRRGDRRKRGATGNGKGAVRVMLGIVVVAHGVRTGVL